MKWKKQACFSMSLGYISNPIFLWSASLAGNVTSVDGLFTCFNVDPVAGFHLINGTAGVVMKLAGIAVSNVGEGRGTD